MNMADVREKCKEGKITWSAHAVSRLLQRDIARADVLDCISTGEIIEEYPDYWLSPACLVYGMSTGDEVLHVVLGLDDAVHIVTAYYPSEDKFLSDLKTRREK